MTIRVSQYVDGDRGATLDAIAVGASHDAAGWALPAYNTVINAAIAAHSAAAISTHMPRRRYEHSAPAIPGDSWRGRPNPAGNHAICVDFVSNVECGATFRGECLRHERWMMALYCMHAADDP